MLTAKLGCRLVLKTGEYGNMRERRREVGKRKPQEARFGDGESHPRTSGGNQKGGGGGEIKLV